MAGRKEGALTHGSFTYQLMKLKVGQTLLWPYSGGMPNLSHKIRLLEARFPFRYEIKTCTGHTVDMEEVPFKFFRITRLPDEAQT